MGNIYNRKEGEKGRNMITERGKGMVMMDTKGGWEMNMGGKGGTAKIQKE
jgi:hypothetical protein